MNRDTTRCALSFVQLLCIIFLGVLLHLSQRQTREAQTQTQKVLGSFDQLHAAFKQMEQANAKNEHSAQVCNQALREAITTMRAVDAAQKGSGR